MFFFFVKLQIIEANDLLCVPGCGYVGREGGRDRCDVGQCSVRPKRLTGDVLLSSLLPPSAIACQAWEEE